MKNTKYSAGLRAFIAVGIVAILAACTPETKVAAPVEPKPFSVSSVKVVVAEGAAEGRFEDAALRAQAVAQLEQELTKQLAAVPGGNRKGHAVVTITTMRLKAAGARAFGGVNQVTADVVIKGSNGAELLSGSRITYADQAKNTQIAVNAIPIGLLINLARNADDSGAGEDLAKLLTGFSGEMVAWLKL
jgi:hypothetical protein